MPKIARSPTQKKNALIVGIIKKYSDGRSGEELAIMAGMSESAFYRCMRDPGRFRIDQLRGICKGINVPNEEMMEVLL
jgi:hypothetical protein